MLEKRLKVMDATAISLCMDNQLPILVFNLRTPGNLRRAVLGEAVGSVVRRARIGAGAQWQDRAEGTGHGHQRSQIALRDLKTRMDAGVDHVRELANVRTGRASVGLLENIHVEAYGAKCRSIRSPGSRFPSPA